MSENSGDTKVSVSVRFTPTEEDYRRALSMHKPPPMIPWVAYCWSVSLIAMAVSAASMGGWWITLSSALGLFGLNLLFSARKNIEGVEFYRHWIGRYIEYQLSDAGLQYSFGLGDTEAIPWQAIARWFESEEYFILLTSMYGSTVLFPKRDFESWNDIDRLRALLVKNVGRSMLWPGAKRFAARSTRAKTETEPVQLRFTLTRNDVTTAMRWHKGMIGNSFLSYAVGGMMIAIGVGIAFVKVHFFAIFWFSLGVAMVLKNRMLRSEISSYIEPSKAECSYEISDAGVKCDSPSCDNNIIGWDYFSRWSESKQTVVLFRLWDSEMLIFPKRAFTDQADIVRMRNLLKTKLG